LTRINRAKQARALLYGLVLFVLLFALTAWVSIPRIEDDLRHRSEAALADHGFSNGGVSVDGRKVTVAGARSEADAVAMDGVVRAVRGVARVEVPMPGGRAVDPSVPPDVPAVEAALEANTVTLRGQVPGRPLKDALLAGAARAYGPERVVDELAVTRSDPAEAAAADVAALATFIGSLPERLLSGLVTLDGRELEVAGLLRTGASPADVDAALATAQAASPGLTVTNSVKPQLAATTTAPADPAAFTIEVANGYLAINGRAAAEDATLLLDAAGRAFGANVGNGLTVGADPLGPAAQALAGLIGVLPPAVSFGRLEVAGARSTVSGVAVDAAAKAALDAALATAAAGGLTVDGAFVVPAPPGGEDLATQALEARLNRLVEAQPIAFGSSSAQIAPTSAPTLDQAAAALAGITGMAVTIEGHTDSSGNAAQNQALSQQRANAVRNALIERGVNPATLAATGFGDTRPRADNATEAGREQNRRVQFDVQRSAG
jgi:OOP family OmpA-OmpF porin